jgi:hypothetical protein
MPGAMRRLTKTLLLSIALLALTTPMAFAQASGEGAYGETDDKIVTNTAFMVIAFFPLFVLVVSLVQWRLEKRKDAKKDAVKLAGGDKRWSGGW